MTAVDHLALLEGVVAAMTAALRIADPDDPVPACPDWTVRDLTGHLIGVHRWARSALDSDTDPGYVGTPPTGELDAAYEDEAGQLLEALRSRPADAPAWTFDRLNRTAGFWRRRQLHEVAVHRWDVQPYALDDVQAADGIDEVLDFFAPRQLKSGRATLPEGSLHFVAGGRGWRVGTGNPGVTVLGSPATVLLRLWGRGEPLPGPWADAHLTP